MTNDEIASRLNEIAALMEFDGEPFFKTKAYQRAARSVEDSETPMRALIDSGELLELPGVGKTIGRDVDDAHQQRTARKFEPP